VSFSGKHYEAIQYELDPETELLNYDALQELAEKEKPKMILAGYTAYPREVDFKRFSEIAKSVGAYFVADISHIAGLVAGGVHQSPVPYADAVMTTTHKTLRGPRGAIIMCKEKYARKIDRAVFPGLQGGPHNHVNAAKAVAFKEAMTPEFKTYAEQLIKNARALGKVLLDHGLRLVSKGTDTHLLLVDLSHKGLTGAEASDALDKAAIYTNKNTIPFDPRPPMITSGLRLGSPVMTTRGLKEKDMEHLGKLICRALDNHDDDSELSKIKEEVRELMNKFPVYGDI
jgi:glycine hydroxymethyltransferase